MRHARDRENIVSQSRYLRHWRLFRCLRKEVKHKNGESKGRKIRWENRSNPMFEYEETPLLTFSIITRFLGEFPAPSLSASHGYATVRKNTLPRTQHPVNEGASTFPMLVSRDCSNYVNRFDLPVMRSRKYIFNGWRISFCNYLCAGHRVKRRETLRHRNEIRARVPCRRFIPPTRREIYCLCARALRDYFLIARQNRGG